MQIVFWAALVVCAYGDDAQQFVKSVKGVHSNYQYKGGDTTRFFGYNNTNGYNNQGFAPGPQRPAINFEVGVCYIEVPTARLARDPAHIPAGNGSRSDLSRIRTCCEGYQRNVYNYLICEPACSKECVNGLCTAPETCSCFPDHVKNLGGFCVATCPIGCQNGHCAGGECLCKEGFKLDIDSKFCIPTCKGNCGGVGNCTSPNTCECKPGYQTSPDGSCKVPCDHCINGECLEPNVCRCRPGYSLKSGVCEPECHQNCGPNSRCIAPNLCSNPSSSNTNPGHQMHLYPPSPKPMLNQNHSGSYPSPNQTPSQYPYGQNPSYNQQGSVNQQYPIYPITHNITYPSNFPSYPGSQVTTTKPSSYGHQPHIPSNQYPQVPTNQFPHDPSLQYPQPSFNQYPDSSGTNQGSYYPQSPISQNVNVTIPSQYPLYSGNQFGNIQNTSQGGSYPNQPRGYPYPGYPQNPNQPQQNEFIPYYQNPQKPNSTSLHQGDFSHPTNSPSNHSQQGVFSPGQGIYGYTQGNHFDQVDQFDQTHEAAPLCSEACINAVCVGYNQCKCNPGYIKDDDDPTGKRCEPHCPGGCPNGYCAAPYSCACNEGYHKDTSVKGRALCIKRQRRSLYNAKAHIRT